MNTSVQTESASLKSGDVIEMTTVETDQMKRIVVGLEYIKEIICVEISVMSCSLSCRSCYG